MAYVPQSNEYPPSPPYSAQDTMHSEMKYQPQQPPPGQPAYYISQPPPPPPVIVQPLGGYLGHNPQPTQCPTCRQQIVSLVTYEAGAMTWLIAFLICFFGGIFGCCLIPFCVPGCQDAVHTCPACHTPLGRRSPF